jgi:membrane protein
MKTKRKRRWDPEKKDRARAWAVLAGFTGAAALRLRAIARRGDYQDMALEIRAEREALAAEVEAEREARREPRVPVPVDRLAPPAAKPVPKTNGEAQRHRTKGGFRLPGFVRLAQLAAKKWSADAIPRRGAALAYYSLFAIGPILIIAIAVAGMAFGEEAARGQIVAQMEGMVGRNGAVAIQTVLQNAAQRSTLASIGGIVTLILAATGAFLELQAALNTIWRVETKKKEKLKFAAMLWQLVWKRLRSLGLVVSLGFLLMVSLAASAALAALGGWMSNRLSVAPALLDAFNLLLSIGVITALFALIYRILPDRKLQWRDVWTGALITSLLFALGKEAIGLYLGRSSTASAYGAAGSFVVLLLWVYYSAQIALFGAEYTRVFTLSRRRVPPPEAVAEKMPAKNPPG